jgi:uncharacterized protein YodC (DUF2158 family)
MVLITISGPPLFSLASSPTQSRPGVPGSVKDFSKSQIGVSMAAPYQVGDVVELKSGGPNMTVESCDDQEVVCIWFSKDETKRGVFPNNAVKKVGGWTGVG